MAPDFSIKRQIESIVHGKYFGWKIGMTDDPPHKKARLGQSLHWFQWETDNEQSAHKVIRYFHQKGMKPDHEQLHPGLYIYIAN